MDNNGKEYLTPKEVAAIFNVNEQTIRIMCQRGKLPHYRLGANYRIKRSDLDKLKVNGNA